MLLSYLYHKTLVDHIVSEANRPASEACLDKFGAKRQFFASLYKRKLNLKLLPPHPPVQHREWKACRVENPSNVETSFELLLYTLESPFKGSQTNPQSPFLETSLKHQWNFPKTHIELHHLIPSKCPFNTFETFLKHPWNFL